MSPDTNVNQRSKMNFTEHAILQAAIALWMDVLDTDPIIFLGRHRSTGGLTVIPIQDEHATSADVVETLEETIAYIKKADPTLKG